MVHKEGIVYFLKSPDNKYYVGTTRQTMQKTLVQLKSYAKKGKTCRQTKSSNRVIIKLKSWERTKISRPKN